MLLAGIHVEYMAGLTQRADAEKVGRSLKMDTGLRRYDDKAYEPCYLVRCDFYLLFMSVLIFSAPSAAIPALHPSGQLYNSCSNFFQKNLSAVKSF